MPPRAAHLCHGSTTGTLNGYGHAIQINTASSYAAKFTAIENLNSDGDSGGSTNLAEITAGTQPGWTSGNNTVYVTGGTAASTQTAPAGIGTLDPAAPVPAPQISVTPTALDFGATTVGTTRTMTTSVQNLGNANLVVSSASISGNSDFSVGATSFTIAPGGSARVITVSYTPSAAQDDGGSLLIASNDPKQASVTVSLHGTGTAPPTFCGISITPLSLSFGNVAIGQSPAQTVSIGNTGTAACSVSSLAISPAEFSIGSTAAFTVQPGNTVSVAVNYTPTNTGADSGALVVRSNDPSSPSVSVSVGGTGILAPVCNLSLSSASLAFSTVAIGSTANRSVQLNNTGTAACQLSALTVSGSGYSLGSGAPSATAQIAPGGSASVPVTFSPVLPGASSGSLTIASNDPDTPSAVVTLTGTGQQATTPCSLQATSTVLNFGSVVQGTTSTLSATLTNAGGSSCTVNSLTVAGTDFDLGSSAPSVPLNLAAGGSAQVPVAYSPTSTSPATGSLSIGSTDQAHPVIVISLSGAGAEAPVCAIQVEPLALSFGGVPLGSTASRTTTITNTGNANCRINSLAISNTEFTVASSSPSIPRTLVPGEASNVGVIFTPIAPDARAGTLTIATTDPDQPSIIVSLAGTGVPTQPQCDIQVTPLALSFGTVAVGDSVVQQVNVSNAGTGACTINWQLAAGGSVNFTIEASTQALPGALAPGGSVTVAARYAPSEAGGDSGALQITSEDPSEPQVTVALSGSGFVPAGTVDLAIVRFSVTEQVTISATSGEDGDSSNAQAKKRRRDSSVVSVSLVVGNLSQTNEPRLATVTGVQNGVEVYRESQTVSAPIKGRRRATFSFPSYQPTAAGEIQWTVVVADDVSSDSTASATTEVVATFAQASDGERHDRDDSSPEQPEKGDDDSDEQQQRSSRREE